MNRAEFLAALEAQLQDITAEEREEALKFYNEYLDEAGVENEAAVLAELGSPQKVANIIRANCGFGTFGQNTSKPDADTRAGSTGAAQPATGSPAPDAAQAQAQTHTQSQTQGTPAYAYSYPSGSASAGHKTSPVSNRTLWIILIIVTCPIWLGILGGILGVLGGLFGAVCALVFGGLAVVVAGLVSLVSSFGLLFTSVSSGILMIGISLLCIAVGGLMCCGTLWILAKLIPMAWHAVKTLIQRFQQK